MAPEARASFLPGPQVDDTGRKNPLEQASRVVQHLRQLTRSLEGTQQGAGDAIGKVNAQPGVDRVLGETLPHLTEQGLGETVETIQRAGADKGVEGENGRYQLFLRVPLQLRRMLVDELVVPLDDVIHIGDRSGLPR